MSGRRVVFLDRDGVLVPDEGVTTTLPPPYPDAPGALAKLTDDGWALVVVTNQTAVARGLITEEELEERHVALRDLLAAQGAVIQAFLYCPHHPEATLAAYRCECECRKPRPGLLFEAARRFGADLSRSVMVGDRMTDVEAGHRAGCATILVESGRHNDPRIVTVDPAEPMEPHARVPSLGAAVASILEHRS